MLQQFLAYLRFELNRSSLTEIAYKKDISQFLEWIKSHNPGIEIEDLDFNLIDSGDIRSWMNHLAKSGDSPRTIRRKIISLRSFFKWMVKNSFIKVSPLKDVALPKIAKPLPNFIKPAEIETAIKHLQEEDDDEETKILKALILEMFYSLGIRRAELIGLNDSDISFSNSELKVTGKRSKQRVIPVPEKLLSKIREWQKIRNLKLQNQDKDNPLFVIKGKRISPQQVYKIVNQSLRGSSARRKSPHALRHSFASAMLNEGAEIDSVREFLGHASLATTQIYTHISLAEIKKAYSTAHPRSIQSED